MRLFLFNLAMRWAEWQDRRAEKQRGLDLYARVERMERS